ncbi:MAG TPA: nitrilase-related carbon-nitrogen hydrolase [Verrucomicrobiae bacterium]|nr:nitrilase-related carbon-nitrogen hydrolase [Verrucomicrobiae bacterium]
MNPLAAATLSQPVSPTLPRTRGVVGTLLWILIGAAAFHVSYMAPATSGFVLVYLFALIQLAESETWRAAFYSGLAVGVLIAAGRLDFFWRIFGAGSIALWLVYAFWIGLFTAVARLYLRRFPKWMSIGLVALLWCALEYFRSELYYLRFAWLTPGFAFAFNPSCAGIGFLGVYGVGLALMLVALVAAFAAKRSRVLAGAVLAICIGAVLAASGRSSFVRPSQGTSLSVVGIQLEFAHEKEVLAWLNDAVRKHPDAQLLVLSEYAFEGPVPAAILDWCRRNQRYLLLGVKEGAPDNRFYNTAEIVSPAGDIVFRQAKRVPIQFFNDGLPSAEQRVWNSPWGKLGICICYDLSYSRVTDRLIRMGAQALIVPTMDVTDWGKRQHELHARVGPVRAAEYHVPVFRLASSGISQAIDASGRILATAPFPGQGALIAAHLDLDRRGRLPWDRWLAPIAALLNIPPIAALAIRSTRQRRSPLWSLS